MNRLSFAVRVLVMVAGFFYGGNARADCVDTVGLTAAERDFYNRANAALKSLLPPAPVAESLWSRDTLMDAGNLQVCKGDKKAGDFTVTVQRTYVWPDPKKMMADTVSTLVLAINVPKFAFTDSEFSGVYGSPSPARSAGLKVNNVVWNVTGGRETQAESLRASLAAAVERARLEALIGRPLPSVAESAAAAKKLPPTQLVTARSAPAASAASGDAPSSVPQSASSPATAPAVPAAPDTVKDAVDTVNKLRGLFGR